MIIVLNLLLVLASILVLSSTFGVSESFAEQSKVIPISITTDKDVYEKAHTVIISITNKDPIENAIFNFEIADPNGTIVEDDSCLIYEKLPNNTLTPLSELEIIWDIEKCNFELREGVWEISSKLTSENRLTELVVIRGIELVTKILTESDLPGYIDPNSNPFVFTSGHYGYTIPYQITNATLQKVSMDCKYESLDLEIITNGDGKISLDISKELMSSPSYLLLDHNEANSWKIDEDIITIFFTLGTERIEILGGHSLVPTKGSCKQTHFPPYSFLLSPLKQMKNGIEPNKVICKENLGLIFKATDLSTNCVKPDSIPKLIERGWAKSE